ncbi:MAG: hypothetical protein ACR2PH_13280, partial [Desulfobulbia bacterium]
MNSQTKALVEKIAELEERLEVELAKRRAELRFGLERGKVVFEKEILRRHKELKVSLGKYVINARPLVELT